MSGQPPPGVPATLRTGFGDVEPNTHSESLMKKTIAMTFVLVRRAARHAATYADHAHRNEVSKRDIELGLRHSARHFFDEDGFDEVEKEVHEVSAMMEQDDSDPDLGDDETGDDETGDDEDDETDETGDDEDDMQTDKTDTGPETPSDIDVAQPWSRSMCECSACVGMHHTESTWDSWMPDDPVEMFLKKHADKAIATQDMS